MCPGITGVFQTRLRSQRRVGASLTPVTAGFNGCGARPEPQEDTLVFTLVVLDRSGTARVGRKSCRKLASLICKTMNGLSSLLLRLQRRFLPPGMTPVRAWQAFDGGLPPRLRFTGLGYKYPRSLSIGLQQQLLLFPRHPRLLSRPRSFALPPLSPVCVKSGGAWVFIERGGLEIRLELGLSQRSCQDGELEKVISLLFPMHVHHLNFLFLKTNDDVTDEINQINIFL